MQYWMGTENNAIQRIFQCMLVWESASHGIARYPYIYIYSYKLIFWKGSITLLTYTDTKKGILPYCIAPQIHHLG